MNTNYTIPTAVRLNHMLASRSTEEIIWSCKADRLYEAIEACMHEVNGVELNDSYDMYNDNITQPE